MRPIEELFEETVKKNPKLGSFICFCKTVTDRKYTKELVAKAFNKLVNKKDYEKKEKRALIEHAFSLCKERKT